MFTKEQLSEICEIVLEENKKRGAGEKPLYIMYDQIYAMLTFGEEHFNPVSLFPELRDYTIFVDGTSKCFAATGVRVGWGFGPTEVIDKMKALLTHVGAWAPKPEQEAVAKFYCNISGKTDKDFRFPVFATAFGQNGIGSNFPERFPKLIANANERKG